MMIYLYKAAVDMVPPERCRHEGTQTAADSNTCAKDSIEMWDMKMYNACRRKSQRDAREAYLPRGDVNVSSTKMPARYSTLSPKGSKDSSEALS